MHIPMLHIHDEDDRSEGGPPGWLAFAVVGLAYGVLVGFFLIYQLLF